MESIGRIQTHQWQLDESDTSTGCTTRPLTDIDPQRAGHGLESAATAVAAYDVAEGEGGVTFDDTSTVDRARKILLKAPTGTFAFGTTCAVCRTLYTRYSVQQTQSPIRPLGHEVPRQ